MSQYVPVLASNRSAQIRIDGQKVPSVAQFLSSISQYSPNAQANPVYVNVGDQSDNGGLPAWKELASHIAVGQLIVVGPVTSSNQNVVVQSGGTVTAVASALEVNVAAGELKNRATGVYTPIIANATLAFGANTSGNTRIDLVVVNDSTGVASIVAGTPAANPVAPATPAGDTALATVQVVNNATQAGTITDVRPRP